MRRLAVVVTLSTGCFTSGHHHNTAYHLNGAAAAVGGFLLWAAPTFQNCDGLDMNTPQGKGGASMYSACQDNNHTRDIYHGLGAGLIAAAVIGIVTNYYFFDGEVERQDETLHPLAGTEQTSTEIELMDVGTTNPQLINLTKEAAFAARKGNCRVVRLIYQRVRVIDSNFAATGFVKDNTIERCVTQQDTQ